MSFEFGIRCISEKSKGFGNLSRCMILSKELMKKQKSTLFIIDDDFETKSILNKKKIKFEVIPKNSTITQEIKLIHSILIKNRISKIIIDAREKGEILAKKLRNKLIVISIDDAWIKNVYADIIFNVTEIKKYHRYKKKNPHSRFFLGNQYFIMNKNFQKNKKAFKSIIDKKRYDVVLTMGGSDPKNLSQYVLSSISKIEQINLKIILGPYYSKKSSIQKIIKSKKNCKIITSPKNIWKVFYNSDLVITNAGSTLFEISAQGIPNISIIAFRHQKPYAEYFHKKNITINLGSKSQITKTKLKTTVFRLLQEKYVRKKMCMVGPKIIDGLGTKRVCKIICDI